MELCNSHFIKHKHSLTRVSAQTITNNSIASVTAETTLSWPLLHHQSKFLVAVNAPLVKTNLFCLFTYFYLLTCTAYKIYKYYLVTRHWSVATIIEKELGCKCIPSPLQSFILDNFKFWSSKWNTAIKQLTVFLPVGQSHPLPCWPLVSSTQLHRPSVVSVYSRSSSVSLSLPCLALSSLVA